MTDSQQSLKRLLANGPLTAVPKRPSDQRLLMELAVARFEPGKTYREGDVNEILKQWIDTFCEPYGIDHVSMRRYLVDARLLARDSAGASYRVAARTERPEAEPAQVLAEIQRERAQRKDRHLRT